MCFSWVLVVLPQGFHFFVLVYWEFFCFNLLYSKHSATWRPAFIIRCPWIPSCLAISFTAKQFHFYFLFYSSEQFHCSHLLSRTIKRENPVLPENIPRIPGIWTSSWQKQKLCFYWVELCYPTPRNALFVRSFVRSSVTFFTGGNDGAHFSGRSG